MSEYGYIEKNCLDIADEIRTLGDAVGRKITLVAVTKSGTEE